MEKDTSTYDEVDTVFIRFLRNKEVVDCSFFQRESTVSHLIEYSQIDTTEQLMWENNRYITETHHKKSLREYFGANENISLNIVMKCMEENSSKPICIEVSPPSSPPLIDLTESSPDTCARTFCTEFSSSSSDSDIGPKKRIRTISGSSSSDQEDIFLRRPVKRTKRSISEISEKSNKQAETLRYSCVKEVSTLPYDINGEAAFKLLYDKTQGNRMKSSKDGRPWDRYNKCFLKCFNKKHGKRLRSLCKGSFQCFNIKCPFALEYGKRNSKHYIKIGDEIMCEECEEKMNFVKCEASKIWEFPNNSDYVYVFHHGKHTCFPVDRPNPPSKELENMYKLNPSIKPCQLTKQYMMKTVSDAKSVEEVRKVAASVSDTRNVRNLKHKILGTVGTTQKLLDLQDKCINTYNDPFLLFEFQIKEQKKGQWYLTKSTIKNNHIVSNTVEITEPENYQNYVIKSSKERMETFKNNCDVNHYLGDEWVFVDFKENRVKSKSKKMKTFGVHIHHTLLKTVNWLFRMDCEKEDRETVLFALTKIDEMLCEYTGNAGEIFTPGCGWMLDEGGGLHAALQEKFGKEYCNKNVITCRFHLAMCASRHARSTFIGCEDKDIQVKNMKHLVDNLVHAPTVNSYMASYRKLEKFIEENNKNQLKKWLYWWDMRRHHVMQAFRPQTNCPNTNLAEAAHASMELSGGSDLNLCQTAIFDIAESFQYAEAIRGYGDGAVKSGKGPSQAMKKRRTQQQAVETVDMLLHELDTHFYGGAPPTKTLEQSFTADQHASHRADKGSKPKQSTTRPVGRTRVSENNKIKELLKAAKDMQLTGYKLSNITINSPTQGTVAISKIDESVYYVTVGNITKCTCPFAESQWTVRTGRVPCKHRLFLLSEIGIEESDTLMLQFSYTDQECRTIIKYLSQHKIQTNRDPIENVLPRDVTLQKSPSKYSALKESTMLLTEGDPYYAVFLQGLVKKCYGCEKLYDAENRTSPNDLIIRHVEVRPQYRNHTKEWFIPADKKKSNAYYHLNINCIRSVHTYFSGLIQIPTTIKMNLTNEHFALLKEKGFTYM